MLRLPAFPCHCRRSSCLVTLHGSYASTFLRPLTPRALSRFFATMGALTPTGRLFGPLDHEHLLVPVGLPACNVTTSNPSVPNHPATPILPFGLVHRSLCSGWQTLLPCRFVPTEGCLPHGLGSRLRTALAGSPVGVAESDSRCVVHVVTDGLFTSGSSPPRVATTQ